MLTAADLASLSEPQFIAEFGGVAEDSPWVAERVWSAAPFGGEAQLAAAFESTIRGLAEADRLRLIKAHPDLVSRAALAGTLGSESTREQAAAGLDVLSTDEISLFHSLNAAYHARFGFPFVICARENRKHAILDGMTTRLNSSPEAEVETAIGEIVKIVRLRLADRVAA